MVDHIRGLTGEEAARRLACEGTNELPTSKPRNLLQQTRDVLREPMLVLLVAAGTLNFLLAEPLDGIILMSFVIVVITISIYQEHRTESALAALRDLSSPRALVVRDGEQRRIPGRDVVRGDVVVLAEGDRVPADATLVDAVNLTVDESALTGESVPVRKAAGANDRSDHIGAPGGDGTPWLFTGTLVVKGRGVAIVERTGSDTNLGRIGSALRSVEPERTPLQREIGRLVRVVAVIGLLAATAVVAVYGTTRRHWLDGVLAGIGTAMAMLPEEFPVVLTVFLALGAWRMSQRHVLARRVAVIETLGSATAICVDKTGTLTMNSMAVASLAVDGAERHVDDLPLPEEFHELVEYAVLASAIDPFDPMDRAVRQLGEHYLTGTEHLHQTWDLAREYPLSEHLLAMCQVWRTPDTGRYVIAAKGAPEAIADLCHLETGRRAALRAQVDAATSGGLRVLAVARASFTDGAGLPRDQHEFAFELLGLLGMHDPVRHGVADAVAQCHRAGIRVIMITGDYPGTALAVARDVGIDTAAGAITGPELGKLTAEELASRVRTVDVFARMIPEQKLELIRALKANDEIVAMTGDGVNDAPALRAADIGIAMGARGTDVARESAGLVITDDDFASIAGGVRQGRGIYDNLRKAMAYIIAVHVPMLGMALVPVFVRNWPLVLLPVQIAFLELIIDPACSVVFESEQVDPAIMDQPPRRRDVPLFSRRVLAIAALQGASVLAAVLTLYMWAVLSDRSDGVVRSTTFLALVTANVLLILVNRSWRLSVRQTFRQRTNPTLVYVVAGAIALVVVLLTVPVLRDAFDFGTLRPVDWGVSILAAFAGVAWFEVYKVIRSR